MAVGTLEEIIDDNHAIVSTSVGSEHYVTIMSFVDKDQLEPGCTVLLNHKVYFYSCHSMLIMYIVGTCSYRCTR
jgi:ATP-dependent 26S proteasome regulatory subunit